MTATAERVHIHAHDLVAARSGPAGDADGVMRLRKPFEVEPLILDIAP
ncbi:hypothetical protein BJY16_000984 [Actinoplanes octamycinicus]|uniref:Uncharacterized protein n=1 Tax=Actinoplanes octamycinicus TaxID=135948 RepID=A0A7W7GSK4_9ACTN|nr:hypothetical protein [Actinoplanes octamycinicus]MBB4737525.1 hypothetical protein [Actinoplanes octamycinicus]GIE57831.1 hypothetical protein Aoc01nite_32330 [Actinoplanes octamycinicus]